MKRVEKFVTDAIKNLYESEDYKNGEREVFILIPIPKEVKVSRQNIPLDDIKIEYIKGVNVVDPKTGETLYEFSDSISICRITGRLH